jgi:hypothetical protein
MAVPVSLKPSKCARFDFLSTHTHTHRESSYATRQPCAVDTENTPNYFNVWNVGSFIHHFHVLCDLHYHLTENTKPLIQQNLTVLRYPVNRLIVCGCIITLQLCWTLSAV